MKKTIRSASLIVNLHKADAFRLQETISAYLSTYAVECAVFSFLGKPEKKPECVCDIAFCLGGDGTVLYAARCMAPLNVPIFPINLGTLGFIAAVHKDDWLKVYEQWVSGNIAVSRRLMLDVRVERNGKEIQQLSCLNDAVIAASGISKIIRLDVSAENIRLGHYRSDGLIVATPTGSTAYSVAAGGPILDPEMDALIINPICPFTLSNRPIVIPVEGTVYVAVEEEQRSNVLLTVDGQEVVPLLPGDIIAIRKAPYKASIIASDRNVFYKVLRSKLNWSGGPDA